MEGITLSQKDITRYRVIKDSLDRKISNNQTASLLGLSKRQIIRLKNKVRLTPNFRAQLGETKVDF